MSFATLKKIASESAVVQVKTRNTRNVPLRVDSYDLKRHAVKGTDLFTGEEITLKLRPDPMASSRPSPRAEIADFAGEGRLRGGSPAFTQPGGVIVFDYVYPDPDEPGVLSARWGRPCARFDGECDVFVAYAAPFISSRGKFAMDVVRTMAATPVSTLDDLRLRLEDALHGPFAGAVIRATDGIDTVMYSEGYRDRVECIKMVDGRLVAIKSDEAINDFLKTPFGQALAQSLDEDGGNYSLDYVIEVLPVERIFFRREAQAQVKTKENLERYHQMGAGVGFTETILAVETDAAGNSLLAARPIPVNTLPALYQLKNVPTANIAPRVAPYVSDQREYGANPANDDISNELEAAVGAAGLEMMAASTPASAVRPR